MRPDPNQSDRNPAPPRLVDSDEELGDFIDHGLAVIGDGNSKRDPSFDLARGVARDDEVLFGGLKFHPALASLDGWEALDRVSRLRPRWYARWGTPQEIAEQDFLFAWDRVRYRPGERPFLDAVRRAVAEPRALHPKYMRPSTFPQLVQVLAQLADENDRVFIGVLGAALAVGSELREDSERERARLRKQGSRLLSLAQDCGLLEVIEEARPGRVRRFKFNTSLYADMLDAGPTSESE